MEGARFMETTRVAWSGLGSRSRGATGSSAEAQGCKGKGTLCGLGQLTWPLWAGCSLGTCRAVGVQGRLGGGGSPQAEPVPCLQTQDAGTYTCTAENPVGRARRRVHLTILALPVFTTLPGDRSLGLGDRLWLRCAARGSPTPRIGWVVNDQPVTGLGLRPGRADRARHPGRWRRASSGEPRALGEERVLVGAVGSGSPDSVLCRAQGTSPCLAICDTHTSDLARSPCKMDSNLETSGPGRGLCSSPELWVLSRPFS